MLPELNPVLPEPPSSNINLNLFNKSDPFILPVCICILSEPKSCMEPLTNQTFVFSLF